MSITRRLDSLRLKVNYRRIMNGSKVLIVQLYARLAKYLKSYRPLKFANSNASYDVQDDRTDVRVTTFCF